MRGAGPLWVDRLICMSATDLSMRNNPGRINMRLGPQPRGLEGGDALRPAAAQSVLASPANKKGPSLSLAVSFGPV